LLDRGGNQYRGGYDECHRGQDQGDRIGHDADRTAVRQRIDHEAGQPSHRGCAGHFHRRHRPGPCLGRRGVSARPRGRNLWPGVFRENHPGPARGGQRPETGGSPPLSMPSTPWTPLMPNGWESMCDELLVAQPDTGEQALEIADMLLRSAAIDVMVIDSVAALVPRAEIEGEYGRCPHGPAGPADVPGAAQADRHYRRTNTASSSSTRSG
jgi:hypothetical protein